MTALARHRDWEPRLNDWIARAQTREFQWGRFDCLMFAAGAVRAATGFDPARGHRGKYRSAASAARYLRSIGHADAAAMLSSLFAEIPCAMARRGDMVSADGNTGVCIGRDALFVTIEGSGPGLERVPFARWQRAWKIG